MRSSVLRGWHGLLWVAVVIGLWGCSSQPQAVNCDWRLVPINKPTPAKARQPGSEPNPSQPASPQGKAR